MKPALNPLREQSRFEHVRTQSGHEAALAFAMKTYKAYMGKLREYRTGNGVVPPIRENLIRSAYSFRFIIRNAGLSIHRTPDGSITKTCYNCKHAIAKPTPTVPPEADAHWLKCLGIFPERKPSNRFSLPLWELKD